MNLTQITSRLSTRGWLMVGGSAAAAIVFLYLLVSMASAPSYSTLMAGIDPAQTGKITSSLSAAGIPYQIQNNGTAIAVESDKEAQARVTLATAGLLGTSSQPGFSLFDSSSLGQSDFQQNVTYQRALEGQLDQTTESIDGVTSAQVNLVLPNPTTELFSSSQTPATASVLLNDSGSLDPNSVRGIADLVANAVPGLSDQKVTITDQTGTPLWPTAASGGGAGLAAKESAEQSYDSQMAAQLDAMLAQTLGPGKAEAEVNANLNTNTTSTQTLTYAAKGVPLTTNTTNETLTGGNGSTGGVAGVNATTGTNVPSGASKYSNKSSQTTYGVDKTVTQSQVSPGNIIRQSISVLVDGGKSGVPASELPSIKAAVEGAAGFDAKRGDTIAFGQVPFVKQPSATTASSPTKMLGYAKYGLVGLGALLFLFFTSRMLRRREHENFAGQATWLRELEAPRSLASVEAEQQQIAMEGGQPTRIMQLRPAVNVARKQVEDLVERDPDRVAAQVRAWMSED
jgi:flagellar M-ring protein FliF